MESHVQGALVGLPVAHVVRHRAGHLKSTVASLQCSTDASSGFGEVMASNVCRSWDMALPIGLHGWHAVSHHYLAAEHHTTLQYTAP